MIPRVFNPFGALDAIVAARSSLFPDAPLIAWYAANHLLNLRAGVSDLWATRRAPSYNIPSITRIRLTDAHSASAVLTGAVRRGGIVDMAFKEGNLVLGPRALGAPAWVAARVAVVLPRLPGFRSQKG